MECDHNVRRVFPFYVRIFSDKENFCTKCGKIEDNSTRYLMIGFTLVLISIFLIVFGIKGLTSVIGFGLE